MPLSGKETIKILQKHGFVISRQRGSHVIMVSTTDSGKNIAVVPNHREMKKGTLRSIARQSGINPTELGL